MSNNVFYATNQFGNAINPYQQVYEDSCAIKSQQFILNDFGIPATEDQLVQYSYEQGWYQGDGSGTQMQDVGNLLEAAGIPCTRQADANVFNLVSELSQGHKVIVAVDADELYGKRFLQWLYDFFGGETPNHALVVTGIDTFDPNNIQVVVTDPGDGSYQKSYPLDQFMDAWADSSHYMVSTDIAIPAIIHGMENFNYEAGHIDTVAGVNYSDFELFNDMSYGVPVSYSLNNGMYNYPMTSLIEAYHDYANHQILFSDIFDDSYMFNNYLNQDIATQAMIATYHENCDNIGFTDETNWNNYYSNNDIVHVDNNTYREFLNQSIDFFQDSGDNYSAIMCEQQLHMIDYCDSHDVNFISLFNC